jgi:hypothetical protein
MTGVAYGGTTVWKMVRGNGIGPYGALTGS